VRLGESDHNAHSPTLRPFRWLRGYAKTAKWLFTLLTSQAGTGYTSPFFPNQLPDLSH